LHQAGGEHSATSAAEGRAETGCVLRRHRKISAVRRL
jgi:hypothetical protein